MRLILPLALAITANIANAEGTDPFAGVSKKKPAGESAYGCTFSFENWDVYEKWESFNDFAFSGKGIKNSWVGEMACKTSRSGSLHLIDYLGKTENEVYVFLIGNDGQKVSYFFDLNSDNSNGLTIRYMDDTPPPRQHENPGFFAQWAENMFGGGGVSTYTGVVSGETVASDQEVGVKVDGDGWVSENGKKIGRVEVSYGYNILCSNGYNYGSDSVFGGSFKANVNSMDEAISVVLSACKR